MDSAIAALSGGSGHRRVPERGERERDAVGHGERGDRLHQHPAVADDQQEPEHEQQVVDALHDVQDAELQVAERALRGVGDAAEGHRRRRRAQQVALEAAVGMIDAHEHVGDRGFEPGDGERLPRDPPRAGQRAAHDERAGGQLLLAGCREPAFRRHDRRDRDLDLAADRLLPEERVGAGRGLGELEKAGPGLVRERGVGARERENEAEPQREAARHFAALPPDAPALTVAAPAFSTVTA